MHSSHAVRHQQFQLTFRGLLCVCSCSVSTTPTNIQSHQRGSRTVTVGEIGDLAEHLLCGGVLGLEGSFLDEQLTITAGMGPCHPYAIYDVKDRALLKLQPHNFTAHSAMLLAFAFGIDAVLRPLPPSPAAAARNRRAVPSRLLIEQETDEETEDVDVDCNAVIGSPVVATSEWSSNLVRSWRSEQVAEIRGASLRTRQRVISCNSYPVAARGMAPDNTSIQSRSALYTTERLMLAWLQVTSVNRPTTQQQHCSHPATIAAGCLCVQHILVRQLVRHLGFTVFQHTYRSLPPARLCHPPPLSPHMA